jgi:hypothetical protein
VVGLGHAVLPLSQQQQQKPDETFNAKEKHIHAKAKENKCVSFYKANIAALLVFVLHLIKLESLLSCLLTVGMTLYWYFGYAVVLPDWSAGGIDWVVLGFGKMQTICSCFSCLVLFIDAMACNIIIHHCL